MILQHDTGDDFVVATGKQYSVRYFAELCFALAGLPIKFQGQGKNEIGVDANNVIRVKVNPHYYRPAEVETLIGDYRKIENMLGWKPKYSLKDIAVDMLRCDFRECGLEFSEELLNYESGCIEKVNVSGLSINENKNLHYVKGGENCVNSNENEISNVTTENSNFNNNEIISKNIVPKNDQFAHQHLNTQTQPSSAVNLLQHFQQINQNQQNNTTTHIFQQQPQQQQNPIEIRKSQPVSISEPPTPMAQEFRPSTPEVHPKGIGGDNNEHVKMRDNGGEYFQTF